MSSISPIVPRNPFVGIALCLLACASVPSLGEWRGNLSLEGRYFPDTPLFPQQEHQDLSIGVQAEYRGQINGLQFTFVPFLRLDNQDSERTYFDLREADIRFDAADWQWQVGIGKVFWGTAELVNLVDVVNQTDLVGDIDAGEKLGQPMVHATRFTDWGVIEFFSLPGFRERTFPGKTGRLYLPIDTDHPVYESSRKQRHVDWALRWSHSMGTWDLGLAYFYGTRRDPRLVLDAQKGLATPHYDLMHQVSLDAQGAIGNWLLKLEGYYRETDVDDYLALIGGFEYTLYGIAETGADLGLLVEYVYDGRENTLDTYLENDLFLGIRLAVNDGQSSEVLAGTAIDMEHNSLVWRVGASRRLGNTWKLDLTLQGFPRTQPGEPIFFWRKDAYARLQLRHYF